MRAKLKSTDTDQNLDQQIKSQINRSKVKSTDQKLDQQMKSEIEN